MALSRLRQIVEKMASDKKISLAGMTNAIWKANNELREEKDMPAAMDILKSAFGTKFSSDDYKKIEKEAGINLRR
jgi:isopentenyl diphosphate isomerase/L-lactate dehydrogenase-like FMN-dependent dehydrogenase